MRERRVVRLSFEDARMVAQGYGLDVTRFYRIGYRHIWRFARCGLRRGGIVYDSVNCKMRVIRGDWIDADDIYIVVGLAMVPLIRACAKRLKLQTRRLEIIKTF